MKIFEDPDKDLREDPRKSWQDLKGSLKLLAKILEDLQLSCQDPERSLKILLRILCRSCQDLQRS